MKIRNTLPTILLALLVAGCTSDMPTTFESDGEDTIRGKAAQGDRSEWQLMFTWDVPSGLFANGVISCLNDGKGEDSWWAGTGAWYYKEVVTPSGNIIQNLKYDVGDDARIVGMDTGEVWYVYRFNSHFFQHTRRSDGHTYFHQPDHEWFVNDGGERVRVTWLYDTVFDQDMNVVSDKSRIVSCSRMGPK